MPDWLLLPRRRHRVLAELFEWALSYWALLSCEY
jgi:hypothetical protein